MKLQVRVMGGARAGMIGVFSTTDIAVGRLPDSDFPFDPDRDLDVSSRHAVFILQGGDWFVRDLESRNGTFVNGHRIKHDTKLDDTDQIRFGADGPRVEIRLLPDATPDRRPDPPVAAAPSAAPTAPRPTASATRAPSATQRIRLEVGKQTRRLRAVTGVLFLVLVGVAAFYFVDTRRQRADRDHAVAEMQARIDSILESSEQAVAMLEGQVSGLADALRRSQNDVQRLQRDLETARETGSDAEVEALRTQLAHATSAFRSQQLAAQVDYRAINEANQLAVAMIWADMGTTVTNGTAFAVTADGLLITNRHVVAGEDGTARPRDIAIQFANSAQRFPGVLVALSNNMDIAVVQVRRVRGEIPTVKGLASAVGIAVGDPVAMIGFPLGTDAPMRAATEPDVIRTTFTAGTVSKILPDLVQIDGYGAPGASGSPIFNREGEVVGVLYAGQEGSGGRVVFSVPVAFVVDLLRQLGR